MTLTEKWKFGLKCLWLPLVERHLLTLAVSQTLPPDPSPHISASFPLSFGLLALLDRYVGDGYALR